MTLHYDYRSFVLAAIVAAVGIALSWPLYQAIGGAAAHSADVIRSATGAIVSAICSSSI